jgi:hypothetical protein
MEARPPSPRVQSAAVLVPLGGLFLLMPPFVLLFAAPRTVLGIPLIVLYLFGAWAVLIFITWQLSRRLAPPDAQAAAPADGPPPA